MVPLPSFSVPSQTAAPVRVAIVLPPLVVDVMQAILPAILWQTRLSASLSLSARTAARNLFWADQVVKQPGRRSPRRAPLHIHTASGAAAPGSGAVWSRLASASWR